MEVVGRHLPNQWTCQKPTRQDTFTDLPVTHYRWFALAWYSYQVTFVGLPVTQTRCFSVAFLLHKPGDFCWPPCYTNQVVFSGLPVTQTTWLSLASLLHKPGGFQWPSCYTNQVTRWPPCYTNQVVFSGLPVTQTRWLSLASLLHKPGSFQWPPCYTNQVVSNGLPVTQTRWFPMASLLHKPGGFQWPPSYTYQVVFNGLPLTHTRWFSMASLLHIPGDFHQPSCYPPPREKQIKDWCYRYGFHQIYPLPPTPPPPKRPPPKKRLTLQVINSKYPHTNLKVMLCPHPLTPKRDSYYKFQIPMPQIKPEYRLMLSIGVFTISFSLPSPPNTLPPLDWCLSTSANQPLNPPPTPPTPTPHTHSKIRTDALTSTTNSPWYNRTGCLGIKHQLTYLLT